MFRHPVRCVMPSPEYLENPSPRTGLRQSLRRLHHSDPAVFEAVIPNVFHQSSEDIDLETLIPMMQPSPIPVILDRKTSPAKTNRMSRNFKDIRDLSFDGSITRDNHGKASCNDSGFESDVSFGSPVLRENQNGIDCHLNGTPHMGRPSPRIPFLDTTPVKKPFIRTPDVSFDNHIVHENQTVINHQACVTPRMERPSLRRPMAHRTPVIKPFMRSPGVSCGSPIVRENRNVINHEVCVTPQMERPLPRAPMLNDSPIVRSLRRPLRRPLLKRKLETCQSPVTPVAPFKRRRMVGQPLHILDKTPVLIRSPDVSCGGPMILRENQNVINHHGDVAPQIGRPSPRRLIIGETLVTEPLTRPQDASFSSPVLHMKQNVINCQASVAPQIEGPSPLALVPGESPIVRPSERPLLKRKLETCQSPDIHTPPVAPFKRRRIVDQPPITPLQRDLDAILLSIREVFFFNCMAFSPNRYISEERDRAVTEMKLTSESYSHTNLVKKDLRQDYSNWQVRWGYIFVYLMRHAHLVYHSLKLFRLAKNVVPTSGWNIPWDSSRVCSDDFLQKCSRPGGVLRVCAIGGGPGSDLIGLALFLRASKSPVKLSIRVLDLCTYWQHTWRNLFNQLPHYLAQYFLDVRYEPFDYLRPNLSPDQRSIIANADVITVVKSLSPVASRLSMVKPTNHIRRTSVFNILSTASSGAVVLYLDNRFGKQREVMQDAVRSVKGYYLLHHQITKVELPSTGFSDISSEFMKWVGYGPSFRSGRNEAVVLARKITG